MSKFSKKMRRERLLAFKFIIFWGFFPGFFLDRKQKKSRTKKNFFRRKFFFKFYFGIKNKTKKKLIRLIVSKRIRFFKVPLLQIEVPRHNYLVWMFFQRADAILRITLVWYSREKIEKLFTFRFDLIFFLMETGSFWFFGLAI